MFSREDYETFGKHSTVNKPLVKKPTGQPAAEHINGNVLFLVMKSCAILVQRTHKFRLYPDRQQEQKLFQTLDLCRETYNTLLGELSEQKVIDRAQIQGTIPDMKICDPCLKNVYSKTLQYECYRLFSNLRALAQLKKKGKKVGSVRFKAKGFFKT